MVEGVRARKKRERREEIVRVARSLFAEKGYAGTTTAEIAAGAGISLTTVFSYFHSKVDILFSDCLIREEALQEQLEARGDDETTVDVAIAWAAERMPEILTDDPDWAPVYRRILDADPALQAEERVRLGAAKWVLLPAIATDIGDTINGIRSHLAVHLIVGGLIAVSSCLFRDELADMEHREALLAYMSDYMHAGMGAIERPLSFSAWDCGNGRIPPYRREEHA